MVAKTLPAVASTDRLEIVGKKRRLFGPAALAFVKRDIEATHPIGEVVSQSRNGRTSAKAVALLKLAHKARLGSGQGNFEVQGQSVIVDSSHPPMRTNMEHTVKSERSRK